MTVDEQIIPTRHRCRFRQYMPNKPGKYGIKILWFCDPNAVYPLKGKVYVGLERQPGAATLGKKNGVKEIVKRLVMSWINKGQSVTTDNTLLTLGLQKNY